MNRTLKDATVNTFYYATHDQLKVHLNAYLMAYNFAKRLKAIKGNTPWQFILKQWIDYPQYFIINPNHYFKGPNIKKVALQFGQHSLLMLFFLLEYI